MVNQALVVNPKTYRVAEDLLNKITDLNVLLGDKEAECASVVSELTILLHGRSYSDVTGITQGHQDMPHSQKSRASVHHSSFIEAVLQYQKNRSSEENNANE